jgi:hypothetical protein
MKGRRLYAACSGVPKDAIQIVAPVIANPQGVAIRCTRMDCFTLRVRNDGVAGGLLKSPCFLFALLKAA